MKKLVLLMCVVLASAGTAFADNFKVAVYQLPVSQSFVDLFNAIGEVTNNTFTIELVPPARGIYLVEHREVDVAFPATLSTDPKKNVGDKFDYSAVRVYQMVFVLYTNKNNPIDPRELRNGNPRNYDVETTASLAGLFQFEPQPTTSIAASLRKVDAGRINGLVYAQDAADPLLKALGLKNVTRKLYSVNDITFALQKGHAGGKLEKILAEGIAKLKASGRLDKILRDSIANSTYKDWQP